MLFPSKDPIITKLSKKLPWEEFIAKMKKSGFYERRFPLNPEKSVQDQDTGNLMIIGNRVCSGALLDSSHLHIPPFIVFRPRTEQQILDIIKNAGTFGIPITFSSGKTGLSAGYANFGIIADVDDLHTLEKPFTLCPDTSDNSNNMDKSDILKNSDNSIVVVEQSALVSDLIKWIPFLTDNKFMFPIQPSSALELPVRVGGIISTDASGVTSGKLGSARDWLISMRVIKPSGKIITVNKEHPLFNKILAGNGFYGFVLDARFKLYSGQTNPSFMILFGDDPKSAFSGLQEVQKKKIFPLVSEFILTSKLLPGKFQEFVSSMNYKDKISWAVLLKGTENELEEFKNSLASKSNLMAIKLKEDMYKALLKERASLALQSVQDTKGKEIITFPGFEDILTDPKDLSEILAEMNRIIVKHGFHEISIGYGHLNFRRGKGTLMHVRLPVPLEYFLENREYHLQNIAETIVDIVISLKEDFKVKPKAEHSPGAFGIWTDANFREILRKSIENGEAFVNPHLLIYDELIIDELKLNGQTDGSIKSDKKNKFKKNNISLDRLLFTKALLMYLLNA